MKKNLERQACRRKSRAKVKIRLPREFTVGIYWKMLVVPLLCCVSCWRMLLRYGQHGSKGQYNNRSGDGRAGAAHAGG